MHPYVRMFSETVSAPPRDATTAPLPFYVVRTLGWNHRWYRYRTVEPDWDGDFSTTLRAWASPFTTEAAALRHAVGLRKDCFATISVVQVTDRAAFLQPETDDAAIVHHNELPTTLGQFRYAGTHCQASAFEHASYDLWTLYGTEQGDALLDAFRTMYDAPLPCAYYPQ